jgi:hypothetical protein
VARARNGWRKITVPSASIGQWPGAETNGS